MKPLLKYKEKV